jgi:hypothetical protein
MAARPAGQGRPIAPRPAPCPACRRVQHGRCAGRPPCCCAQCHGTAILADAAERARLTSDTLFIELVAVYWQRSAHARDRAAKPPRYLTCQWCGIRFRAGHLAAKWCCPAHRMRAYRARLAQRHRDSTASVVIAESPAPDLADVSADAGEAAFGAAGRYGWRPGIGWPDEASFRRYMDATAGGAA